MRFTATCRYSVSRVLSRATCSGLLCSGLLFLWLDGLVCSSFILRLFFLLLELSWTVFGLVYLVVALLLFYCYNSFLWYS